MVPRAEPLRTKDDSRNQPQEAMDPYTQTYSNQVTNRKSMVSTSEQQRSLPQIRRQDKAMHQVLEKFEMSKSFDMPNSLKFKKKESKKVSPSKWEATRKEIKMLSQKKHER